SSPVLLSTSASSSSPPLSVPGCVVLPSLPASCGVWEPPSVPDGSGFHSSPCGLLFPQCIITLPANAKKARWCHRINHLSVSVGRASLCKRVRNLHGRKSRDARYRCTRGNALFPGGDGDRARVRADQRSNQRTGAREWAISSGKSAGDRAERSANAPLTD